MVRSLDRGGIAGNIKLRGKKGRTLNCLCCDVFDLRDKEEAKRIKEEIEQFKLNPFLDAFYKDDKDGNEDWS